MGEGDSSAISIASLRSVSSERRRRYRHVPAPQKRTGSAASSGRGLDGGVLACALEPSGRAGRPTDQPETAGAEASRPLRKSSQGQVQSYELGISLPLGSVV